MNEYPIAPVSNKAVIFISLMFSSIHEVVKASPAKKLSSKNDNETINGFFLPLFITLAEVKRFMPAIFALSTPPV